MIYKQLVMSIASYHMNCVLHLEINLFEHLLFRIYASGDLNELHAKTLQFRQWNSFRQKYVKHATLLVKNDGLNDLFLA